VGAGLYSINSNRLIKTIKQLDNIALNLYTALDFGSALPPGRPPGNTERGRHPTVPAICVRSTGERNEEAEANARVEI
jgi:hypothetical protein